MYQIVLVVNLLICITLIGLVLLQRSEGGALGVGGGGGGGALMSGRGAANALAQMTSVAGGLFLVCSFLLTFIAQADRAGATRSIILNPPAQSAPASPAPAPAPQRESSLLPSLPSLSPAPAAAAPVQATPVSAQPQAVPSATAPAPTDAQTRAGPVQARVAAATQPPPVQPRVVTVTPRPQTPAPAQSTESRPRPRPPAAAVTQPVPESVDAPPSEPPRRERAGPDQ